MLADIMIAGYDPISGELATLINTPDIKAFKVKGSKIVLRHDVVWEITHAPTDVKALPLFVIRRVVPGAPEGEVILSRVKRITNAPDRCGIYIHDTVGDGGVTYIKHSAHYELRLEEL